MEGGSFPRTQIGLRITVLVLGCQVKNILYEHNNLLYVVSAVYSMSVQGLCQTIKILGVEYKEGHNYRLKHATLTIIAVYTAENADKGSHHIRKTVKKADNVRTGGVYPSSLILA